jgi:hypothetical protein
LKGARIVGDIASWAFLIGVLLVLALPLALAIASLWLWGGARRGALGRLMAGALLLVSGAVFYYVQVINVFARMDNAYLFNIIFGLYFMFLGVTLLAGALVGYGVPPWLAALLWIASVVFGRAGISWLAKALPDEGVLLYAAILLGSVLLYMVVRSHFIEVLIAVCLVSLGFALIWRIAGLTMRDFTPVTIVADEYFYKPPYLDLGAIFTCVMLATVLFFAGRFIQGLLRSQRPPAVAEVVSPD